MGPPWRDKAIHRRVSPFHFEKTGDFTGEHHANMGVLSVRGGGVALEDSDAPGTILW